MSHLKRIVLTVLALAFSANAAAMRAPEKLVHDVAQTYDASGNQTVKTQSALAEPFRTTRYSYDALNRLSQVRDGAGQLIASYSYDPFDRRLRKTLGDSITLATTLATNLASSGQAAGQATSYLHTDWGILAEANATGQIQASYGYNPQRDNGVAPLFARVPVKDSAGNATGDYRYTYYHNDHLGTPQRITDKAGNLLWTAQYDAYGKAIVQTTASAQLATANDLRLPGQYRDAETGLHYNFHRYYQPDSGRYVTRDPIGFEGGLNHYQYADSNPVSYADPLGLGSGSFGFNVGPGFQVSFGRDDASSRGFMDFKLGWGLGVTAKYDPLGGLPNSVAGDCGRGGVDVRAFLELLKLQGGPVDAKVIDAKAGYTLNTTNFGHLQGQANRYFSAPKPKAQMQGKTTGIDAKVGSVGVGFSIYSGADSCTCRN